MYLLIAVRAHKCSEAAKSHYIVKLLTRVAFEPRRYVEYDKTTVLQMMGRAGRPQFDDEGIALIMTQRSVTPRCCGSLRGVCQLQEMLLI